VSIFSELKRRNVFRVAAAYVIVGWLIMQVGEVMAPALNLPDWILSALAFFVILGFPLALFFAWAFEMTPEGLRLERDVNRSQSITQVTGRKLDFTIIALLALALGYFAVDKFVLQQLESEQPLTESQAESRGHSIAVLPLADMSPAGDHEYFSDGLTEELLNILAKIQELRVAGRTSSFAFKGKNEDLRDIGRKLNVESILEGSVRKDEARNRVRITLQLINAEDGYHLWSETYDRDLDDIFAIQEEVAFEVAKALRITLLGEDAARLEQVATTEIDAYDLYLQGMHGIHQGGFVQLEEAVQKFQASLALDPHYTPARIGLVNAWTEMAQTGAITPHEATSRGIPLVETTLAEQPHNSAALVQMALLQSYIRDESKADEYFRKALELDSNSAQALQEYGRFLYNGGEIERGMELIEAALKIEPLDTRILWDQCQTNAQQSRRDVALPACERIMELEPHSPLGYYGMAQTYLYQGDLARTLRWYANAIEKDPGDFEMIAAMSLFWTELGDADRAQRWLQRAEAIGAGQAVPTVARVHLYQFQERFDLAGELAEKALERSFEDRHGAGSALRLTVAFNASLRGDFEHALAPYRRVYPWAFEAELEVPAELSNDVDDLLVVASLMKQADPLSDRPGQLLAAVEPSLDQFYPGWGIWHGNSRRARIEAIQGNYDKALEYLTRARAQGFFIYWRFYLLNDPVFNQLKEESGFQELIAWYQDEMDRQREVAYELMGAGP